MRTGCSSPAATSSTTCARGRARRRHPGGAGAGTAIQRGVDAAIHAGVPVGGISAGLAVLGGFAFTAERDTITSAEALADPFDDRVRLARGFLTVPALEATITDSHLSERERLGRLLAFMARIVVDRWASHVRGIGIDEETAVLVAPDGTATVEGAGAAWFLRMHADDVLTCVPREPLVTQRIRARRVRSRGVFDLPSWAGTGQPFTVSAGDGSVCVQAG